MNAYLILMGLLVLAYAGSALFRGRSIRGYGLPSGTEYLVLGVAIGPIGLATLTRSTLATFEPLAVTGLSWLAFVAGSGLGFSGEERIAPRRVAGSIGLGAICVAISGAGAYFLGPLVLPLGPHERWYLALGVGCACGETTRAAVRWVAERHGAAGPLTSLMSDLSEADDSVPFMGLAVLFAIGPTPEGAVFAVPPWAGILATVLIGLVLGATASALSDVETRRTERWGILLGTALLNTGVTMRLGLSAPSSMFTMGVALNLFSRDGRDLRAMLASTERPVMLPALVLAGAHLDLREQGAAWGLVAIALVGRVLAKAVGGLALRQASPAARAGSPALGFAMLSSGALTACVGLATALRFPGPVGRAVLATSIASGVLGELLGPLFLRRELRAAGEISEPSKRTPIPVAPAPTTSPLARRSRAGIVPARARSRPSFPSNPDRGGGA